jgi:hypothetical protein
MALGVPKQVPTSSRSGGTPPTKLRGAAGLGPSAPLNWFGGTSRSTLSLRLVSWRRGEDAPPLPIDRDDRCVGAAPLSTRPYARVGLGIEPRAQGLSGHLEEKV